jgi:hypothetical protein
MTDIPQTSGNPVLAAHAAEIRRLGGRIIAVATEAAIEIGRHLTEAKAEVGHGHFGDWLKREFDWSDRAARNFMHVYEMSLNNGNVSDLNLPMRALYALAAQGTPEEARTEIIERAAAGEQMSGTEVKETIARVMHKGDTGETAQVTSSDTTEITQVMQDGTAETAAPDDVVASAEGAGDDDGVTADLTPPDDVVTSAEGVGDDGAMADPTPPASAPNRAAAAAAAVNGLSGTELQDFLNRLWPAPRRAFELKFGARNSDNTNDVIATLAGQCSVMLSRPQQNTDDIHRKLAHIKRLTGSSGKARAGTVKSNAQLDRGAFARGMGMGMAGPTGEKFPTMQMEPTGTDASGNTVFAQPRGNIHGEA